MRTQGTNISIQNRRQVPLYSLFNAHLSLNVLTNYISKTSPCDVAILLPPHAHHTQHPLLYQIGPISVHPTRRYAFKNTSLYASVSHNHTRKPTIYTLYLFSEEQTKVSYNHTHGTQYVTLPVCVLFSFLSLFFLQCTLN